MKRLLTLLILAFFLTGTPIQANAAPTLELGTAMELEDGTASLNLSLSGGDEAYAGMNAKILLPKGITVTDVSEGELLSSGNFTIRYQTFSDASNDGVIVVAYSTSDTFSGSGILLTLELQVSDSVSSGQHDVEFATTNAPLVNSRYALSNSDGSKSVSPTLNNGKITILKMEDDMEDDDEDGLPDDWEMEHFGNLNEDGEGSSDGDEFSNSQEYKNGTDPTVFDYSLKHAIKVLQAACEMDSVKFDVVKDVSGDGKIGIAEAAYILREISGL